jgi:hypothetical protein
MARSEEKGLMSMRRPAAVAVMLVVAAGIMRAGPAQSGTQALPAAVRQQLVKWLPDLAAFGGKPVGEPVFYGDNLFEYIDGGAEAYHQYHFIGLVHQKYKAGDVELTADIYDMGNALNAFGIYASERAPAYNYIAVGAEGYLNDPVLNFLQGACYIKLSAASTGAKAAAVLEAAARSVSAKIGAGKALPAAFALFPLPDRVPRSERFVRTSPLGHDYLAPMFQVDYSVGGRKITLALSEAGNPGEALARAKQLEAHFAKAGKATAAAAIAPGAVRGTSRYDGEMAWVAKGRYLALVIGASPGGDDVFKAFLGKLPPR